MDPKKLQAIVEILEGTDVSFVEWRKADERWIIRRGPEATVAQQPMVAYHPAPAGLAAQPPGVGAAAEAEPEAGAGPRPGTAHVTSPFVGTFYRAPSPEAAPFVEVGDTVQQGQSLCIIEAMKLMNEIEADVAGRISRVLVQNGQAVEYGEVLFEIELS